MTTSSYPDTRLLIANEWLVEATGGKTIPVVNPATGQPIGTVAHASIADLDRALAAAQKGFEPGATCPRPSAPPHAPRRQLLRERAGDIARLLTQEQGKPLAEAKGEAMAGAEIIDWFAAEGHARVRPHRPVAQPGSRSSWC
jgi:succinate-semialdehyde dehydrogenase/glutarate-semialdehyde dehydrogenase